MKFCDESIDKFLNDLGSDLPAPGGGSVAGLIAAISGALNSMVYSLTVNKKAYIALEESEKNMIVKFEKESKEFTQRSLDLMEEDRANFLELMDCYKLPKNTDEEKEHRKKELKDKTKKSMEAPLVLARESLAFYENLNVMAKYGNKMLLSDLGISVILLHSAIESSIVNVKVNLNSLRDDEIFESIDKEMKDILNKSAENKEVISKMVNEVIYPSK